MQEISIEVDMDGVLVIDKEKGYTSHDVVNVLRKKLNIKKVGHAGTLDPNATGVLLILVGQGTKLSKYLIEHDKTYVATLKLGEKTDTGDSEGNVIEIDNVGADLVSARVTDITRKNTKNFKIFYRQTKANPTNVFGRESKRQKAI